MSRAVWLLLALLAGPGAVPSRAGRCQPGEELRELWGGGTRCCPLCTWAAGDDTPCVTTRDLDCKCPQGFSCSGTPCEYCHRLPHCGPGHEPHRAGEVLFHFECRPCENGTYSSSRNSWCRNWTDCESSGFVTLRAGNSTHNSVCTLAGRELEPARLPLELGSGWVVAVLAAAAALLLLLLSVGLSRSLRSLRGDGKRPQGDLSPPLPRPRREESCSIQFPEEEHGEKNEEKNSSLSLKIYSELK